MNKTPEEIKKGLECCKNMAFGNCVECGYKDICVPGCMKFLATDALSLIRQLEAENTELKRERDAALADFKCYRDRNIKRERGVYACDMCKHGGDPYDERTFEKPCPKGCEGYKHWKWRGPCEENGGQKEEEK